MRFLRRAARLSAAGVVLLGLAGATIVAPVDDRPYFLQPYYQQSVLNWRAARQTAVVVRGEVAAGFAAVKLTPELGVTEEVPEEGKFHVLPLAGYGGRAGRPASGVRDDLFVKAVAVRVREVLVVWLGADLLIVPPEVKDAVVAALGPRFGLQRGQIYLGATHTHCSLGGWGRGPVAEAFAGRFHPGVNVWLTKCMVRAVEAAVADLQPARIGAALFAAPEWVRNRLVGDLGEVDMEFALLVIRQEGGRMGVVGSYGAHATVLGSDMMQFSGDYPGAWQRFVESATGGCALFLAGAVGSQSPVPGDRGLAGVQRMGRALAERTLEEVAGTVLESETVLGWTAAEVHMPPLNWRVHNRWRLRPWLAERLLRPPSAVTLQAVRVGRMIWLSTPCDFSGELAVRLKEGLAARGYQGVVTSFNGDYVGYVIPGRYQAMAGYEPRTMSFFGPYVGDYFQEGLRKLAGGLIQPHAGDRRN
jgi:hypothetical protein